VLSTTVAAVAKRGAIPPRERRLHLPLVGLRARSATTLNSWVFQPITSPPANYGGYHGITNTTGASFRDRVTFTALRPSRVRFGLALNGINSMGADNGSATGRIGIEARTDTEILIQQRYQLELGDRTVGPHRREAYTTIDAILNGSGTLDFTFSMLNTATATVSGSVLNPISGQVSADFTDTGYLGIQALDAHGNDITAHTGLQFASGGSYAVTVAPEPQSYALIATGLALLVAFRRRIGRS
jgi:hypothetical protein